MGWETRGGANYYYTAERINGRVVKRYVGSGPVAELAAQLDAVSRSERDDAAETVKRERDALSELESALMSLHEFADAVTTAALIAAGCHRPKRGKWRRRRA